MRSTTVARQPHAWTVLLLAVMAVVMIGQHPIARTLGTEPAAASVTVSSPGLTAPVTETPAAAPQQARTHPVAHHAPVDPFAPWAAADGSLSVPAVIAGAAAHIGSSTATRLSSAHRASSAPADASSASPVPAGCSAVHVVRAGESLWSIAAGSAPTGATGHTGATSAWHALYAANRATIGADPGQILVGEKLCLPQR